MYLIEEVIKHRKPMRLIDELLSFDETSASVSVHINNNCPFYNDKHQGVPSYVGIEYMAQCIAASAGANEKASDSKIKLGFLLGTRKYHPNVAFFNVGDMLIVSASRLIIDASGLSVFDCKISNQNDPETILATAKINVYQPTDTDNYLQAPKDKENNE